VPIHPKATCHTAEPSICLVVRNHLEISGISGGGEQITTGSKKYLGAVVQGISKGVVVDSLLSSMVRTGKPPDFVLCIGDDRSDEDMFESIVCPASSSGGVRLPASSEVFACTVGKKPSMAKYYLDDTVDVVKMLDGLASAPSPPRRPGPAAAVQLRVSFEGSL
jgi:trehalose 6-phosphate synthase/phosphatase